MSREREKKKRRRERKKISKERERGAREREKGEREGEEKERERGGFSSSRLSSQGRAQRREREKERDKEREEGSLSSLYIYIYMYSLFLCFTFFNDFHFLKYSQKILRNLEFFNLLLEIKSFNKIHDKNALYKYSHVNKGI